jgi:hypothetical protein
MFSNGQYPLLPGLQKTGLEERIKSGKGQATHTRELCGERPEAGENLMHVLSFERNTNPEAGGIRRRQ